MKQFFLIILLLICTISPSAAGEISISTTIPPFGMILSELISGRAEITVIIPPGASPHTYELRPSELRQIQESKVLFFGDKNLDGWIRKIDHPAKISLSTLLPEKYHLEIGKHQHGDHSHSAGFDPHFWNDPIAVSAILPGIVKVLIQIDPQGTDFYNNNAKNFADRLVRLDHNIREKLGSSFKGHVLLAQPFFQYYLHRFSIPSAGILEHQPGVEPTPRELKHMIEECREHNVKFILTQAQLSDKAAKIIAESVGVNLVELDPLGGMKGRKTYEDLLQYNTNKLLEARKNVGCSCCK